MKSLPMIYDDANPDEKAALRTAASEGQEASSEQADTIEKDTAPSDTEQETDKARKPGRQPGSQGFGRTQN